MEYLELQLLQMYSILITFLSNAQFRGNPHNLTTRHWLCGIYETLAATLEQYIGPAPCMQTSGPTLDWQVPRSGQALLISGRHADLFAELVFEDISG
jgi:hypothetical protein